jgi:hypothetical protein
MWTCRRSIYRTFTQRIAVRCLESLTRSGLAPLQNLPITNQSERKGGKMGRLKLKAPRCYMRPPGTQLIINSKGATMQTTRKHPRTLEEAFGPYQRPGLVEHYDPMPRADRIVTAISIVGLLAVAVMAIVGVI